MIVSFAWTTPALISGHKTMTRRDWSGAHAAHFHGGQIVDAWDHVPRVKGARKVATIRLTKAPHREWSSDFTEADYVREGFFWLCGHGECETVERIIQSWRRDRQMLWVVEFELVEVVA